MTTKDAIIAILTVTGRPMAEFEIRYKLKKAHGIETVESSVRSYLRKLIIAKQVVQHKGKPRREYTLFGLPGQEIPDDLDRCIRHIHGSGPYKARW